MTTPTDPGYVPVSPPAVPVEVPTRETFDALRDRVAALESGGTDTALTGRVTALEGSFSGLSTEVTGIGTALGTANTQLTSQSQALNSQGTALGNLIETVGTTNQSLSGLTGTVSSLVSTVSGQGASIGVPYTNPLNLDYRVGTLESTAVGANPHNEEVIVRSGASDSDVQAAISSVLASRNGTQLTKSLVFMPGVYTLSTPLIPATASALQVDGLVIRGLSASSTVINWRGSGAWIDTTAMRFRNLVLRDLGFNGDTTARTLIKMISGSSPYNNKWLIENVDITGSWNYVFGIGKPVSGSMNLNSELVFRRVSTAPSCVFADAFMHCGLSNDNSENQALDHVYYDCNFSLTSGKIWHYARGGSVHVYGGSCSAANGTAGPITWIHLPGSNSNNPKVNQYSFTGVFFEPKRGNTTDGTDHKVIYCERAEGTVSFRDCEDLSSLQQTDPTAVNAYTVHHYKLPVLWGTGTGSTGPGVVYENHVGVGKILVDCSGTAQGRGGFRLKGCTWYRGLNYASAPLFSGTDPVISASSGTPRYSAQECNNIPTLTNWN
jgi:hypothetical protein